MLTNLKLFVRTMLARPDRLKAPKSGTLSLNSQLLPRLSDNWQQGRSLQDLIATAMAPQSEVAMPGATRFDGITRTTCNATCRNGVHESGEDVLKCVA